VLSLPCRWRRFFPAERWQSLTGLKRARIRKTRVHLFAAARTWYIRVWNVWLCHYDVRIHFAGTNLQNCSQRESSNTDTHFGHQSMAHANEQWSVSWLLIWGSEVECELWIVVCCDDECCQPIYNYMRFKVLAATKLSTCCLLGCDALWLLLLLLLLSCLCGKTTSLNCGHQQAYCSSSGWCVNMEKHGDMILAGENSLFVYQSSLAILPAVI
jgi:hypothetical protein